MDNSEFVQSLLEVYLGKGKKLAKGDYAYFCPICQHKNEKLMVNVISGVYNCFTCHPKTSGKSPVSLFKKIKVPNEAIIEMRNYFPSNFSKIEEEKEIISIIIPKEFISLSKDNDNSLEKRHAISYLKSRQITLSDIQKYNIGYCSTGRYKNKVIIPSYDSRGRLNYFIARSFEKNPIQKIDAPSCTKSEIIGFEYFINWSVPVILCEGIFDAMAIKRNAIPLFGKTISKALMIKLLQPEVKTIYLALDEDAIKESIDHAQQLLDYGKEVYLIELEDKDPSKIGFEKMIEKLQFSQPITVSKLLKLKIEKSL
jgi:DNA primase